MEQRGEERDGTGLDRAAAMLLLQLQAYCNMYKLDLTRMAGGSCDKEDVRMRRGLGCWLDRALSLWPECVCARLLTRVMRRTRSRTRVQEGRLLCNPNMPGGVFH
jgi:hypothetical protein